MKTFSLDHSDGIMEAHSSSDTGISLVWSVIDTKAQQTRACGLTFNGCLAYASAFMVGVGVMGEHDQQFAVDAIYGGWEPDSKPWINYLRALNRAKDGQGSYWDYKIFTAQKRLSSALSKQV